MRAVSDHINQRDENTEAVLVTFAKPEFARLYAQHHEVTIPILADPDRVAYRAYGLDRGKVRDVWGWQTITRYTSILRGSSVSRLHRPQDDTLQLGGDFIVAPDGTLAWGHWSNGPADRPSIDTVIANLRRAA